MAASGIPMFSDSFELVYKNNNENVDLIRTGIAWVSDKEVKFNNPSCKYALSNFSL